MITNKLTQVSAVCIALLCALILSFGNIGIISAHAQTATTWYVTTTGNDSNSCTDTVAPCLTINGALAKASTGDTVEVAAGTYLGTVDEVVLIDKAITLLGGWDAGFTSQNSLSILDGQTVRRGITITADPVVVDHFKIQNGYNTSSGGGISVEGGLTLSSSVVSDNASDTEGGGISMEQGTLTVNNSTIDGNSVLYTKNSGFAGGVAIRDGSAIFNNSTISHNTSGGIAIDEISGTSVTLNNTTVSSNTEGNGVLIFDGELTINNSTLTNNDFAGVMKVFGNVVLMNSITAGNLVSPGDDYTTDCTAFYGVIQSNGYNLIGNAGNCHLVAGVGDQIAGSNSFILPLLGPLQDNGGPTFTHALLGGSPALRAGNPATPGSGGNACLATDQRGVARNATSLCDIGAYQADGPMAQSIKRANTDPSKALNIGFNVVFTEAVTGVDVTDFELTSTGSITGASVTNISGAGATYFVTVNTGSGSGTIRLDVADDDSILDGTSAPLGGVGTGNGDTTSGEAYTIDKTPPSVSSILRAFDDSQYVNRASVAFAVIFSETVTGVDKTDFALTTTGALTGAAITDVIDKEGGNYYIVVNTGSGDGTLRLDLVDNDSIKDALANRLGGTGAGNGNFSGGESYTIDRTPPKVLSIKRADPNPTSADSVNFTVTFSEAVRDVNYFWHFNYRSTGLGGISITNMSGSGSIYTVTIKTVQGRGALRLDLIDEYHGISDLANNGLQDGNPNTAVIDFTDGETYSINRPINPNWPLDSTFGINGFITRSAGYDLEDARSVAIQPNGKIVMFGSIDLGSTWAFLAERYNADGSPDTTFDGDGIAITTMPSYSTWGNDVAIQPNGKIVGCGYVDPKVGLVRYDANGALDTTFGSDGRVMTGLAYSDDCSLAILPNGQILVAAQLSGNFAVQRYNSNGSVDTSFGTGGTALANFGGGDESTAITLQPDGKIVLAGTSNDRFAVARFNSNGSLDTSFGSTGKKVANFSGGVDVADLAVQPDGKIVVIGTSNYDVSLPNSLIAMLRYNPDGSLDTTFDGDGRMTIQTAFKSAIGKGVLVQPDGRIMVLGNFYDGSNDGIVLMRYKNNGTLDTTFGSEAGGIVTTLVESSIESVDLAFTPDGKLIVAGTSRGFALARYNVDYSVIKSNAAEDGWLLESSENSNVGGTVNNSATTINLGDDASNNQYRGVISFNTASIPDTATITGATLKIKREAVTGTGNPFTVFQGLMADIKNGFFDPFAVLQTADFQSAADKTIGPFHPSLVNNWYSINLNSAKTFINKLPGQGGLTQIRLRFNLDDDNNGLANYLSFYSGNAAMVDRPQLSISYSMPALPTRTPTVTPTRTPTVTSTVTRTPTMTRTITRTRTPTKTRTVTRTPTSTPTPTDVETLTATPTPTETQTPTEMETETPTPTP